MIETTPKVSKGIQGRRRGGRPWVQEAYDLLWEEDQPRTPVVEICMRKVRINFAAYTGRRKANRDQGREDTNQPVPQWRTKPVEDEDTIIDPLIRKGAQRLVLQAIHNEIKRGRMVRYEKDGRMWLGLTDSGRDYYHMSVEKGYFVNRTRERTWEH